MTFIIIISMSLIDLGHLGFGLSVLLSVPLSIIVFINFQVAIFQLQVVVHSPNLKVEVHVGIAHTSSTLQA